jgi:dTDP-4-dehydrorhamnose 3,5-epimerase
MTNYGRLIEGVEVHQLKIFRDKRGVVMRMMRADDPFFQRFGEIYFSVVEPHVVKAWHLHKQMTLNYACVSGRIRLVLFDDRENSPTRGIVNVLNLEGYPAFADYDIVKVPHGIWNGFRAVPRYIETPSSSYSIYAEAIVANCANMPHDPEEIERVHPTEFPLNYDWGPHMVAG